VGACPSVTAVLPLRDDNPTRSKPIVTLALIALCAVVYFFVQPTPFASTTQDEFFEYRHAAIPTEVVHGTPVLGCGQGQSIVGVAGSCDNANKHTRLSVITSIFLHASILHLLGNMLYLWIFGNNVEDRLGRVGFALFFVVGGVVATLGHILADSSSRVPVVGASGAIAAVMGAYLVWYPRARVQTLVFFFAIRLPAFVVLLVWLVLQFFTASGSHVAWVT
jgi:membrane associated rhomboid family serine protease